MLIPIIDWAETHGLKPMQNALSVLNEINSVATVSDSLFTELAGEQNNYSSRLQLFSYNSGPVKDNAIKAGHFGIVNGQNITDLDEELTLVPVAIRCKAMDLSGDRPAIAYDPNSEMFGSIRTRSKIKDSNCMCGVEFLVYLPDQDAFTTFYLANATLLREAQGIKNSLGMPLKIRSKVIKKEKLSWHGVTVAPFPADVKVPEKERFVVEIKNFTSAQDSVAAAAAA